MGSELWWALSVPLVLGLFGWLVGVAVPVWLG